MNEFPRIYHFVHKRTIIIVIHNHKYTKYSTFHRKILREKKYLTPVPSDTSSESDGHGHSSVGGKSLDENLIYFSTKCKHNLYDFLQFVEKNELSARKRYEPIFITPEDKASFESIEKRTQQELWTLIETQIKNIEDYKQRVILEKKWKKVKHTNKATMVNFYQYIEDLSNDIYSDS